MEDGALTRISLDLRGIKLTRLSPTLWFFNNYGAFRSRIDSRHKLDELVRPADKDRLLYHPPQFYFKESSDNHPKHGMIRCIEFGIVTNESTRKSIHWSGDRQDIPLGRLPDALFNDYYADENFTLNTKIASADMGQLLAHYGWRREERDYDGPFSFEKLGHQFMTVYVDGV